MGEAGRRGGWQGSPARFGEAVHFLLRSPLGQQPAEGKEGGEANSRGIDNSNNTLACLSQLQSTIYACLP